MGDPPIHDAGLHAGNSAYDLIIINGPLGAVTGALGDAAGARHFDGVDDQARIVGIDLSLPVSGNPLTVEFFINPDAYGSGDDKEALEINTSGGGAWWSGGGGANIDMEPSAAGEATKISFGMHIGGFLHRALIDRSLIPVGQWTHVVAVFTADTLLTEANRLKVYINGVRQTVTFGADTEPNPTSSGNFGADSVITLMGRQGTNALNFPGGLDEFAIYKTELSPTRIAAHFDCRVWSASPGQHRRPCRHRHGPDRPGAHLLAGHMEQQPDELRFPVAARSRYGLREHQRRNSEHVHADLGR
jgi:hypothetical protein